MKILIVDDESISRKILMKKMELIGDCTAVDESLKALELFDRAVKEKAPFDLITLDVSMPKMDGRQLLSMIRKKEKAMKMAKEDRVKIIMVTSRMNVSTIKECIRLGCNGYISKPVNKYQLLGNLGRMGFAQPETVHESDMKTQTQVVAEIIQRFYKGKISLPVLPGILKEVQALLQSPDASIKDLAKIIEKDIVISSKLIFIANSPLYRGIDKVDSLNAALLRLGRKATYGMISTLITRDLFKSGNTALKTVLEKLWSHSFACACMGKRIAQELKMESMDTVFLMGIVHDIGKMLLMKAIVDVNPWENINDDEIQLAVHEIHTTFGAVLLKKMRFSKEFVQIAEFHHWNDFSVEDEKELLVIHLSDYLANHTGFNFLNIEDNGFEPLVPEALKNLESLKQLNLDPGKVMEMADEVKVIIGQTAQVF